MKSDGFTLFEVITTLSLISILLVICVPKITTDFGYMDRVAEEFLMDVRFIQMESMKYATPLYQITVDSNVGEYYLRDEFTNIKTISFRDRYTISYTGRGALYFTIDGAPINPGTFTIIDKKTNKSKSVTIVPATGRTIILE